MFKTALKFLALLFLFCHQSYAEDVLSQITVHLVKTKITQGTFSQEKNLKVLHKPLLSTGTFIYDQSKGVVWKTLTPVESVLVVNDTKLLTQDTEQAVPATFGKVFKALLGADLKALTDSFSTHGSIQKSAWSVELTPKDELLKKIFETILLTGDTELRGLELKETTGNNTRIRFDNIAHPAQLSHEQQADFERLSP